MAGYERPSWDEYFMAIAILASTRSVCRYVKSGCVIAINNRIIGTGYNGVPPGIRNCSEIGCRKDALGLAYRQSLNTGTCDGIHAEMNALANLSTLIHHNATCYTTIFPCKSCTKNLLAYNIKRIVYKRDYDKKESALSLKLFKEAGIDVVKLDLSPKRIIEILFSHPQVNFDTFSEKEKKEL